MATLESFPQTVPAQTSPVPSERAGVVKRNVASVVAGMKLTKDALIVLAVCGVLVAKLPLALLQAMRDQDGED